LQIKQKSQSSGIELAASAYLRSELLPYFRFGTTYQNGDNFYLSPLTLTLYTLADLNFCSFRFGTWYPYSSLFACYSVAFCSGNDINLLIRYFEAQSLHPFRLSPCYLVRLTLKVSNYSDSSKANYGWLAYLSRWDSHPLYQTTLHGRTTAYPYIFLSLLSHLLFLSGHTTWYPYSRI